MVTCALFVYTALRSKNISNRVKLSAEDDRRGRSTHEFRRRGRYGAREGGELKNYPGDFLPAPAFTKQFHLQAGEDESAGAGRLVVHTEHSAGTVPKSGVNGQSSPSGAQPSSSHPAQAKDENLDSVLQNGSIQVSYGISLD